MDRPKHITAHDACALVYQAAHRVLWNSGHVTRSTAGELAEMISAEFLRGAEIDADTSAHQLAAVRKWRDEVFAGHDDVDAVDWDGLEKVIGPYEVTR